MSDIAQFPCILYYLNSRPTQHISFLKPPQQGPWGSLSEDPHHNRFHCMSNALLASALRRCKAETVIAAEAVVLRAVLC
jgi:hypothetical protein